MYGNIIVINWYNYDALIIFFKKVFCYFVGSNIVECMYNDMGIREMGRGCVCCLNCFFDFEWFCRRFYVI